MAHEWNGNTVAAIEIPSKGTMAAVRHPDPVDHNRLSNQSLHRTLAAVDDDAECRKKCRWARRPMPTSRAIPRWALDRPAGDRTGQTVARVIEAAKRSKYSDVANQFEWEVTVIKDDKTMNAFALPGGEIAVCIPEFSPWPRRKAGLAAVMGHEVVHALARHGGERMSQNTLAQTTFQKRRHRAGVAAPIRFSRRPRDGGIGVGAQVGVLLPSVASTSQKQTMSVCCWRRMPDTDPREAIQLWQRMGEMSGGKSPVEVMSTHPSHETRFNSWRWMAEAMPLLSIKPPAPQPRVAASLSPPGFLA